MLNGFNGIEENRYDRYIEIDKHVKRAKERERERGRVISIANIGALARCQVDIRAVVLEDMSDERVGTRS